MRRTNMTYIHANRQYFENRSRMIQGFKETKEIDPYPHKFHVSISLPAFIEKYQVCI